MGNAGDKEAAGGYIIDDDAFADMNLLKKS